MRVPFLQSMLQCACPPAAALTAIPADDCFEQLGQIQKFMVQRTKDGSTINTITIATTNPNLLATWTALKAAVDNTKVVVSPFVNNPANEAGEAREFGSDNQVVDGAPILLGRQASVFTSEFYNIKQSIVSVIKGLECEKELSVFLITESGNIVGLADDPSSPTTFKGIPIRSFFVSDKVLGNFDEPDRNFVRWSFLPNWSDLLYQVTPSDFDAKTEL